jgi:uncharacterized protein (DUF885 family)
LAEAVVDHATTSPHRRCTDGGGGSAQFSAATGAAYWGATGTTPTRIERETNRSCVSIGQACSYKIGHLAWTRARAEAEKALGSKFDLRRFHEVLKEGAMPLSILAERVKARTAAALRI